MHKGRLEAFSDGVIAIIITIMVLELHAPHEATLAALAALLPAFFSYVLSFIYVGIYWNNHHHMLQAATRVNGAALWANLHLLFWLSLIPFFTRWVGDTHFAATPTMIYGIDLLMCGVAYSILSRVLIRHHGKDSALAAAFGSDVKGNVSLVFYVVGIATAFAWPWIASAVYSVVAVIWLIPDRRIERSLRSA